jgi:membrane protein implicated in regulation of membrane protease activity
LAPEVDRMGLFLLILLLVLLATGALWAVVKVALGVALGLLIVVAAVGAFVTWRVRRAMRGSGWRQVKGPGGSSEVTVFYREPKDDPRS